MHDIKQKRQVVKTSEREQHLKPAAFAFIDKNLLNHPFENDARVVLDWQENKETGWQWVDLPKRGIRLRLPKGVKRRHPTGLDSNVWYTLFGEGRKQKQQTITMTLSAIVKLLGLSDGSRIRGRVNAALRLGTNFSIRIKRYYSSGKRLSRKQYQQAGRGPKLFHPPISKLSLAGRSVTVTLNKDWYDKKGFIECVPLPLSTQATARNIETTTLAYPNAKRTLRKYYRKIGLIHHNRRRHRLTVALEIVKAYYARNGGSLSYTITDDEILFQIDKPWSDKRQRKPKPSQSVRSERHKLVRPINRREDDSIAGENTVYHDDPRSKIAHDEFGRMYIKKRRQEM
jgi:hypothetical protein